MELLQLFYFDAIARHENITRAADELHISQPSLSGSLLRLERELGYPLFERRARRLFLNPAGRLFWEKARQILQLAAECRLPPDRGPSGQLSVAFQNHNEPFFRLIQAFGRAYPDIRLYIYQSTLHESFSTTSFDFLISTDRHTFPTPMEGRLFARRRWYAVVPAASPFSQRESLSPEDLQNEPFCFLQDRRGEPEEAYRICLRHHFVPRCAATTNSPFYKQRLLLEGELYGFIPSGWVAVFREEPAVRVIPLVGEAEESTIWLFWKKEEPLSSCAQQFLAFLEEAGAWQDAWQEAGQDTCPEAGSKVGPKAGQEADLEEEVPHS